MSARKRAPSPDDEPEWWGSDAKAKRNTPLVVLGLLLAAAGGFGAYLMITRTSAQTTTSADVAAADAGSAELDPATLQPITMHAPLPSADDIFTSRMLRFTVALDQAAKHGAVAADAGGAEQAELAAAEEGLRNDDVRGSLGPRAAASMQELVIAAKTAATAASDDEASVNAFEIATARLDNALIAGGLPYFVDASIIVDPEKHERLVLLYEFAIRATSLYGSNDARVRSVRLRRLDRLNWSHTLLGFVNPHRIYAVVLLDQIDEQLVTNIVPALAADAPMPLLANEAEGDSGPVVMPPETVAISVRAGANVRAEVDAILGADHAAARELGDAVHARRVLFEKWNTRLRGRGTLKSPPKLELDVDALEKEVGAAIPKAEIDQLRALQKRLDAPAVKKAYATLRETFVASVERHEVQHRLDQIIAISPPKALDALVPPGHGKEGDKARDHVAHELSAYLAQLARDEPLTRTTFTMLLRFIADPRVRGTAESYAALIATEELCTELGIENISPLVHDRQLDDARIDRAHRELTSLPPERLREGAKKVWTRLFLRDLPPLLKLP